MIAPARSCRRREVLLVGEHLGHRNLRLDDRCRTAGVHAGNPAAAAVEIAHQIPGEVRRRVHFDVHDRFEDRRPCPGHRVSKCEPAGHLERELVRVDVVVRTVEHGDAEIDHREAGQIAAHPCFLDPFFHGRDELTRN